MKRALAVAVVGGCWSAPPATPASPRAELPGLVWVTPRHPWQLAEPPTALGVDGATAVVGGAEGWLARVDLATGAVTDEHRLGDDFTMFDLAHLPDGRWVAVGNDRVTQTRAFVLDGRTLAPTEIALGVVPDRAVVHAGVAVTSDGGVVIAGKGLPLAIYDPATWRVRRILAAELGWNRPRVAGTTLAISLAQVAYAFELASGVRRVVGPAGTSLATSRRVAIRRVDDDHARAELWQDGAKHLALDTPDVEAVALSDDGTRLVVVAGEEALVLVEPFDRIASTIALGASARAGVEGVTLVGERALISAAAGIRVVDLARGTVSPAGSAPWGAAVRLAIGADDTVLDVGPGFAHWIAAGRVATTVATEGEPVVTRGDDIAHVATRTAASDVIVRARSGSEVARVHATTARIAGAWVGARQAVIVDGRDDDARSLATFVPGAPPSTRAYRADARILAADPDGGDALVASGAGGVVVATRGGGRRLELVAPGCASDGEAALELDGPRALTYAGRDAALWDRRTGALLGTVRARRAIVGATIVPGRDEIVLQLAGAIAFWRPGTADLRVLPLRDLAIVEASARRVALGFVDGRVALLDRDLAAAAATIERAPAIALPKSCRSDVDPSADDPFQVD